MDSVTNLMNRKDEHTFATFDAGSHRYGFNHPKVPEATLGRNEIFIRAKIQTSRLSIDTAYYGDWNNCKGLCLQDSIVPSQKD